MDAEWQDGNREVSRLLKQGFLCQDVQHMKGNMLKRPAAPSANFLACDCGRSQRPQMVRDTEVPVAGRDQRYIPLAGHKVSPACIRWIRTGPLRIDVACVLKTPGPQCCVSSSLNKSHPIISNMGNASVAIR